MSNERDNKMKMPARPVGMGRGGFGGQAGPMEKPKNFKATMKKLIAYAKPFWISIIVVIVAAIISTVFSIISPKILGNATNKIVDGYVNRKIYDQVMSKLPAGVHFPAGTTGADIIKTLPKDQANKIPASQLSNFKKIDFSKRPGYDFSGIAKIAYLLIGLYVISAIFNYIQGWIMTNVSQKMVYKLRQDIATKINELPLSYFDKRTYGEVLSRLTNDIDTISQSLNQSLTQIITSVTTIIGILIMMLTISWQMTLVAIIMLPLSFGIISVVVGKSQKYFLDQQNKLGEINGHIEEMFSGHTVMKVFNGKERSISKFKEINTNLYDSAWKSQFLSGLMMPIMRIVGNLGFVAVTVVGGFLATKGLVNIGDIQAFIQYLNSFTQPLAQTASIANVLQSTAAAAERVFDFLGEEVQSADVTNPLKISPVKGAVEFNNVSFSYDPGKVIINNFSTSVKPGSRIAIVGPTGAGKTTIVNLLMRFYEIDKGTIKIDGVNTKEMKRADVRKLFGMVLQDTWLFNGTIKENIAYGRPNASEKEVIEAAKNAHADHFIKALPGAYDMVLNEEADNISQGEKQLLTIARAMLADTPMLILDEATSSVDTRTEVLIQKAMDKLMKGRTSFIIAHRLSTIRNADLILVMDKGNIVEQGTHDQLMAKKGFYANLYNSQFSAPMVDIGATPTRPAIV
jgi:ATP-binding cassette subfamily B protein